MENNTQEKIYKQNPGIINNKGDYMKVLISTIYSVIDPVMLSITRLGIERVILVIDKDPNETQKKSLELLKQALGKVMDIKTIKTELYDIVKVSEDITKAIDLLSDKDKIYINITGSRKTQSLGLLYAAYARADRVKQIVYSIENQNKMVFLPKLSYNLNKSQKEILEYINGKKIKTHAEFANKVKLSRGMLYRTIKELKDLGLLIEDDEGFKLTDAGRIGIL